jgi:hypothetical protein
LALGKTVRQLLDEIDSAEFTEWQAYYKLEPFGSLVDDERHGVAVSTLANINRDAKVRPEPYKSKDFIGWRTFDNVEPGPILMPDVQAQSELIKRKIFKLKT